MYVISRVVGFLSKLKWVNRQPYGTSKNCPEDCFVFLWMCADSQTFWEINILMNACLKPQTDGCWKFFLNISELFCFCMQMFGCDCHSFYYFVEVTFSLMFFKIDFFDFRFCNRSFSANGYILITVVNNCGKFGYHGFVTMGFGLICCKTNFRNGSRPWIWIFHALFHLSQWQWNYLTVFFICVTQCVPIVKVARMLSDSCSFIHFVPLIIFAHIF